MTKVELTVAGHTVTIEAEEPLDAVAGMALELFRETSEYAKRSPVGYASGSVITERDIFVED